MGFNPHPVCECSDTNCELLLPISWERWYELSQLGMLISKDCPTQMADDIYTNLGTDSTGTVKIWKLRKE